jgi:hypothetical protein
MYSEWNRNKELQRMKKKLIKILLNIFGASLLTGFSLTTLIKILLTFMSSMQLIIISFDLFLLFLVILASINILRRNK